MRHPFKNPLRKERRCVPGASCGIATLAADFESESAALHPTDDATGKINEDHQDKPLQLPHQF
jgi:hypothetical protein